MTDVIDRYASVQKSSVRIMQPGQEDLVWALLTADPLAHCFAASRLARGGLKLHELGGQMWGYGSGPKARVDSAMLAGANMVPIETSPESRMAFAEFGIRQGRRCSSLVGPADEVLDLWEMLSSGWGAAREVRADQPVLVAAQQPSVTADPSVRTVLPSETDAILPACVAMFTEEVGVSPMEGGAGPSYRRRIAELVSTGRSFARFERGEPIFKAEIGAVSSSVCQIQGVWVHPDYRGMGVGSAGIAAVVHHARRLVPIVSLYVNSFNHSALAAYANAGFRQRATFATVLF